MLNFSYPKAKTKEAVLAYLNKETVGDDNYRATVTFKDGKRKAQFIKYSGLDRWLKL